MKTNSEYEYKASDINDAETASKRKPVPYINLAAFQGDTSSEVENKEEEDFYERFQQSILDQTKEYSSPIPIISVVQKGEAIPFLTLKSFSLWQGKQKSKKTTVLALAAAAFIKKPEPCEGVHFIGLEEGVILFFDNEQGESYAARTMKLILKLAGVESTPRLIYCDLREFTPNDRKKIIEAGIKSTPGVKLVVIDGLVDLLNDFMDAGEGHLTTTEILKLCSHHNIHIAGVLHQNKADKNARAHIGTISSQKCEIEISTEVDAEDRAQSLVTCVNSRGLPFEPFAIKWEKGSLPCVVQEWSEAKTKDVKANKNYEKIKSVAEEVFNPLVSLTYTEAINKLMQALSMSEDTAKRRLKDLTGWDIVNRGADGRYRRNNNKGARVQEGAD